MIKLNRTLMVVVLVLAAWVLLGLLGAFLCGPLVTTADQSLTQERSYLQETAFLKDVLATRKMSGIASQLVAKDKVSTVMDAITRLAGQNAVSLRLTRPPFVDRERKGDFGRVLFEMQAQGALKDLGKFLTAVRNMPEGIIDIEALSLRQGATASEPLTAGMTFVLWVANDNEQK